MARAVRPVRGRLTLLATALVTLALLIAGLVMVLVLHNVLLRTADDANTARANEVAAALGSGQPGQLDQALFNTDQNVDLVQIVDAAGQVLQSSRSAPGGSLGPPLTAGQRIVVDGARAGPSEVEYRTTRLGVRTGRGDVTIEVGAAEAGITRLVLVVAALCGAVFPVIVVLVAALTYYFVGRALSPVERIRRQVAEISDADLSERVPVPATHDELETLARTMNAMLARLHAAQSAQRQFVGDASHELNSPLTSIYGLLDLADQTDAAVDVATIRTLLLPEAQRMRRLVADLALLARADERALITRHLPVSLTDLVIAEADWVRSHQHFVVQVHTVPVTVYGDPAHLARVLRNLTDNATRYVRDRLDLTITVSDGLATFAITDDGPGVPESERDRVFERFVRIDAARDRSAGGSGLGLAIVSEIVAAHGGTVGVGAGPDGGARFSFSLPVAQSDTQRP